MADKNIRTSIWTAAVALSTVAAWAAAPPATKQGVPAPRRTRQLVEPVRGLRADPALDQIFQTASVTATGDATQPSAAAKLGNETYVVVHAEFDTPANCEKFEVEGVSVFNRFERWADMFVPLNAKAAASVQNAPGVVWTEEGRVFTPPPPRVGQPQPSRATPERIVRGGLSGLTGKGVLVVVVDSGIDFRHPDFITTDASGKPASRLAYLWDTLSEDYAAGRVGNKAPLNYPNGASLGTLYTQEQLTEDLRAAKPLIGPTDVNGHGTACAGIAAGGGGAFPDRRYAGVAPEAELVGVRINSGRTIDNPHLIGAIGAWVDRIAGSRPAVITCSWGGQYGGRNGSRVIERQLSARFTPTTRGRALCFSAGNEGAVKIHAEATVKGSKPAELTWSVPADLTNASLELYLKDPGKDLTVEASGPAGLDASKANSYVHPLSGDLVWRLRLPPGDGKLLLTSRSGKELSVDGYLYGRSTSGRALFTGDCARMRHLVGTPGTAVNAITVGSYDWNDQVDVGGRIITAGDPVVATSASGTPPLTIGGLSSYSCPGPSREPGVTKPEIAAPGRYHSASAPLNAITGLPRDASGKYRWFDGTSAATPYAAGVIALMFQKKPDLSVGDIKELLQRCASQDRNTSRVPNPGWGYGKLDLEAAQKLLKNTK